MHYLVFEDLNERGYQMMNRLLDFTFKQIEHYLLKLARCHAVSAVYYKENGPYDNIFSEGIYNGALQQSFRNYYDPMYETILKAIQSSQFDQAFYRNNISLYFYIKNINMKSFLAQIQ